MIGFRAPGRVNLIGEHVDYAGGLVLPAALEQGVVLRGVPRADRVVRLTSTAFGDAATVELDAPATPQTGWARYAAAVVVELRSLGVPLVGFEGIVESDLPSGSGLSSSAALELALAGGLALAAGYELAGLELAQLGQRAEHRAVGVPCGIMDQAASALATSGHALLLDCDTLVHRLVPLPHDLVLGVLGTGVNRRLEDSDYEVRRVEVERALAALPPGSARRTPEGTLERAAVSGIEGASFRRLRHVVRENARVAAVVEALEQPGGADRGALGRIFAEGHASLRDDFEVSIPELDLLVELAGEEGAVAARMTGGGFGGAIVTLLDVATAEATAARIGDRYAAHTGLRGLTLVGSGGPGAGPIGTSGVTSR
ncbi:MAG: galactokinase [Actinobacteria bacterium]|nr:galactokinase [Actinomycetota bacterium]